MPALSSPRITLNLTELDAKALKKKQVGNICVPPKYTSADFLKGDYWRLRGKLDVPMVCRGIFRTARCTARSSSPGPATTTSSLPGRSALLRRRPGTAWRPRRPPPHPPPGLPDRVTSLAQAVAQAIDPEFGVPMGDYFEGFIQEEAQQLGKTVPEMKAWGRAYRRRPRPRAPVHAPPVTGAGLAEILRRNRVPGFAERSGDFPSRSGRESPKLSGDKSLGVIPESDRPGRLVHGRSRRLHCGFSG